MAEAFTGRTGTGRFTRTIDTARRDAHWAELRRDGLSIQQIATSFETSKSTVYEGIQRALADVPVEAVTELRKVEADRLDADLARLNMLDEIANQILAAHHYVVSEGHLVKGPDGVALADAKPVLDALNVLRQNAVERRRNSESRRRLFGLDAPRRTEVTVVTRDAIEQAIAEAEALLEQNDPKPAAR